ncbi:hypothetical protein [Mycobacterium asiaticum]|uniref:hypothetical protein n=1 Tax=Mycobacterium asiaticum TaxID=1790 RepID=UPI000A54CD75|nr:hypothetical protein [Mycobacterium asiaticum]
MRFRDIRAGVTVGNPVPSHLAAATTPARPKSTRPAGRNFWYGAARQMAMDEQRQQPKRSRRQRKHRKPRVGRWK